MKGLTRFWVVAILLGLLALPLSNIFAAGGNACIPGSKCIDGSYGIADVDSGVTASVNSDGTLKVSAVPASNAVKNETSQNLTIGAMAYNTTFAAKTKIDGVFVRLSAPMNETINVTFRSSTNSTYDTILASSTLVSESNFVYIPDNDLVISATEKISVSCTNTTGSGWAYTTVKGETLN